MLSCINSIFTHLNVDRGKDVVAPAITKLLPFHHTLDKLSLPADIAYIICRAGHVHFTHLFSACDHFP